MTRRKIEVEMSSKAIDARLRDVAQLRKLGLSIAKAKPIVASEPTAAPLPTEAYTTPPEVKPASPKDKM